MYKVVGKLFQKGAKLKLKSSVKVLNFVTGSVEITAKVIELIPKSDWVKQQKLPLPVLLPNILASLKSAPKIDVPIIWVLGGPGSGKGTQCDKIVAKYGFVHLSSGDLLRNEVASGSPRGKELTAIMESGALVPLEVVLELLKEAIYKNLPDAKGFLIDGYPREKEQGILFESTIAPVDVILFFEATHEILVDRLLDRAKTSGRVDDNEETIKKRLNTFVTHTDDIVNHYEEKLKKIDAERPVEEIFGEVQSFLDPLVKV